jgi:hypothetical protein
LSLFCDLSFVADVGTVWLANTRFARLTEGLAEGYTEKKLMAECARWEHFLALPCSWYRQA